MASYNGHDYVEIAGTKWATMNIGASSVTDYGQYFQWGDTTGYLSSDVGTQSTAYKKPFDVSDYKFENSQDGEGEETEMTKYNSNDGKTVLDLCDDAALANWGEGWRMPTTEEFQALLNAVNTAWTASYQGSGVAGLVCTDKTDSSKVLFFPAAGRCVGGSTDVGSICNYWSSSRLGGHIGSMAFFLYYDRGYVGWDGALPRICGMPVRPIIG